MSLYHLKFLIRQRTCFIDNPIRNTYLADIMKEGRIF